MVVSNCLSLFVTVISDRCFGLRLRWELESGGVLGTAGTAENTGWRGIGEKKVWGGTVFAGGCGEGLVGTGSRLVGKGSGLVGTASRTGNLVGTICFFFTGTAGTAAKEGLFFCSIFFSSVSMESFFGFSMLNLLNIWIVGFIGRMTGWLVVTAGWGRSLARTVARQTLSYEEAGVPSFPTCRLTVGFTVCNTGRLVVSVGLGRSLARTVPPAGRSLPLDSRRFLMFS